MCKWVYIPSSGALGVNLQVYGPIQSFLSGVQCSGDEGTLLSCQDSGGTTTTCESAAGIVCHGIYIQSIYDTCVFACLLFYCTCIYDYVYVCVVLKILYYF